MTSNTVIIYVPLLDEGTPTCRGTQAIDLGNGLYKLLPTDNYDSDDETWEYLPGSIVRCVSTYNDFLGKTILQAVEKVG